MDELSGQERFPRGLNQSWKKARLMLDGDRERPGFKGDPAGADCGKRARMMRKGGVRIHRPQTSIVAILYGHPAPVTLPAWPAGTWVA